MLTREDFEAQELERLASYACRARESRGRAHPEPPDEFRTVFQRDRDRIIHSTAFRRLEYKTQVFVNHEGDYYRTRLTHTLEVAQIARAICRTLRLNEDIAEAIALAHDLGHTPFGHAGEEMMNELMRLHGGFEHNHQSYRVVTRLEQRYPQYAGLNLTAEVLDGIVKHAGEYDAPRGLEDSTEAGYPSLEAQVANLADEIAYTNHDLDDGLQSGMIDFEGLATVPLWHAAWTAVQAEHGTHGPKIVKHQTIRRLLHRCVLDLLAETTRRIAAHKIATSEDIRRRGKELVAFSPELTAELQPLKAYLFDHLYRHYRVVRMTEKAKRVIADLFSAFGTNPKMLPTEFYQRIARGDAPERTICDYIAGMTDRYAHAEHKRLFDPQARV